MATNISKYVQLSDYLLLEYEFNKDGTQLNLSTIGAQIVTTDLGTKQYFNTNKAAALGETNNLLEFTAEPTGAARSHWFNDYSDVTSYNAFFDACTNVSGVGNYRHDTLRLHIVSGYNFDDVAGFLLQVRAEDVSLNLVDLANFTYLKQPDALASSDVVKFSSNALYLGNRFYDKYIELKVPCVQRLGDDQFAGYDTLLGEYLNIKQSSDAIITYNNVSNILNNQFAISNSVTFQLPVTSVADNFNAFITESTVGDFIEYYGTWADEIIGNYIGDIESGIIPLYTSNNPNDNYQEFASIYGISAAKWVLIHELYVYENLPGVTGGSSLLTQKFSFTQEDSFSLPNYFRPVLKNADIDTSYTIQYTCRLLNRMDGTQIIRKASFASSDPKKYGLIFTRLNVDNIIPYNIFNRIEAEKPNIVQSTGAIQTKYSKVFFDTVNIAMNQFNEIFPQGTGPLFLKNGDSVYNFKFEKLNTITNDKENVDLSGAYNYDLMFILDNERKIEVGPTYSSNMNTIIGELEFKLSEDQIKQLLKQNNKNYSIIIKNPDGTQYTFYEGVFFSYKDYDSVLDNFKSKTDTDYLSKKVTALEKEIKRRKKEYELLSQRYAKARGEASSGQKKGLTGG